MARPSMRAAIDAYCKGCIYDELERGGWREQVAACTIRHCPLYALRPMPRDRGKQAGEKPAFSTTE